ncbi:hypothetical protein [Bdellovibrio bacteriovorus]|uniref:hypothetical protein n=1 Tax=Bdellovibrio bacteriovorus TaxID=959 RepID=UPI003AA863F8
MGQFTPGQEKKNGSGRQKGTPNKKTQLLNEILDAKDFCIPEKLMELLPSLSPEKQADILVDLMSYVYPKRKAIEQLNLNAGFVDLNSMNNEQIRTLHSETSKQLFGYDLMNAEQRSVRIQQLNGWLARYGHDDDLYAQGRYQH